jgi:type IX secretion system substrate protein/GLUG motif-containing protein
MRINFFMITLLLFALILVTNGLFAQTQPTDTDEDGYYNISTIDHLRWVSENDSSWTWNFELDNDIDASDTKNWNDGKGFYPIGIFTGHFDGKGYEIDSLFINLHYQSPIGLFGSTKGARIENVGVINCDIYGGFNVGGLVGLNRDSSVISNSYAMGNVSGRDYVGGLVGRNSHRVINCYATGSVTGVSSVGGLVGYNEYTSRVNNSYATGNVTGDYRVGGLVGYNYLSKVFNSYATGNVAGGSRVGGLVGYNHVSKVFNSYATGNVISSGEYAGGLVGHNGPQFSHNPTSIVINNSYATGSVTGSVYVGGLIGCNPSTVTIYNSYATGSVAGDSLVGGLVGSNDSYYDYNVSFPTIVNSYAMGSVTGRNCVGGLLGYNATKVINSYATGRVSGVEDVGGLIGYSSFSTGIINSFWDTQTSGQTTSAGGTAKTTAQMKTKITFTKAGWNFDFIWDVSSGYPFINLDMAYSPKDADSNGSLNLKTLVDLRWLSESGYDLDGNWELDNDINAGDTKNWNAGLGFSPIWNFTGHFDGKGYEIDSLFINQPNQGYIGLFGRTSRARIENIGVVNCDITGYDIVGGLVGQNSGSSVIHKSFATGNITGGDHVGGLVGQNSGSSELYNSYSTGSVAGNEKIGGLMGSNPISDVIYNSYSTGSVTGKKYVGGFVGWNGGAVYNSYSRGNVFGVEEIGGLVGKSVNHNGIIDSYSTGKVTGEKYVGGLVGKNFDSKVKNSFWDTQTSGLDTSANGTGKTTAEMKTKATFTDADWDFSTVWSIDGVTNDGYPFLRAFVVSVEDEFPTPDKKSLIYPNPVSSILYIKTTTAPVVRIYNMTGTLIASFESNPIDVSAITTGFYFLVIESKGKIISREKLVIK